MPRLTAVRPALGRSSAGAALSADGPPAIDATPAKSRAPRILKIVRRFGSARTSADVLRRPEPEALPTGRTLTDMPPMNMPLLTLCAAALAPAPAFTQVTVVDSANGPGAHFTSISAAIAAAGDGETIVVRPGLTGTYAESLSIDSLDLTLTSASAAPIQLEGSLDIRNLDASQTVAVVGFDVGSPAVGRGLTVSDCTGAVWIENTDAEAGGTGEGFPALWIARSTAVTVVDGFFENVDPLVGAPGLLVDDGSVVAFYGSTAKEHTVEADSCSASPALLVDANSDLSAFDSTVVGGACILTDQSIAFVPAAVRVNSMSSAVLQNCEVIPGMAFGFDGIDVVGEVGAQVEFPEGENRFVEAPVAVVAGDTLSIEVTGVAGDLAIVAFALGASTTPLPASVLTLPLDSPQVITNLILGGDGQATIDIPTAAPLGAPALDVFLQCGHLAGFAFAFGRPTITTLLATDPQ